MVLKKMDKKGEKLFSIWWFIIIIIIGLGIVAGVSLFYSSNLDIRSLEADALSSKVVKCISSSDGINPTILESNFDIFSECSLSQSVFDNGKFFIKISVSDFFTGESVIGHSFGNNAFEKNCDIKSKITAVKYPECSSKSVYVIDKDNKKYLVNVLAASNYKGGKKLDA